MATEGKDNVVSIEDAHRMRDDAAKKARDEGAKEAAAQHTARLVEITDLCTLMGCPERVTELVQSEQSVDAIRKEFVNRKAAADGAEIHGQHRPATAGGVETVIDAAKAKTFFKARADLRQQMAATRMAQIPRA